MFKRTETQGTLTNSLVDDYLLTWVEAFLIDRKARGLAAGTLKFYRVKLKLFCDYCDSQVVTQIGQITPAFIREFLLFLEQTGHNDGGRHAAYRTLRAFLYWYEDETEPETWRNPVKKVKAPKVGVEPIDPVPLVNVKKMVKTCDRSEFTGARDEAIIFCLLDTGVRAGELLAIDHEDVNQARGDIIIRKGKGGKPRTVFLGKKSRQALRRYLKQRKDDSPALWVTHPRFGSERLGYDGLRGIVTRRAESANVPAPALHDFRRAFALMMLRSGTDIFTLARLMGHEGIDVLKRYLKQTTSDTEIAHRRAGPVDNMGR